MCRRRSHPSTSAPPLGKPTPIRIDSPGAWDAALRYCRSKGLELANVSYVLNQGGSASTPIWCYGVNEKYLGELQITATDGAIISSK